MYDIEEEINKSAESGNSSSEKKLLLANAMIFYELTDFLIEYIDNFSISGIKELRSVYNSSMDDLRSTRDSINKFSIFIGAFFASTLLFAIILEVLL